ncbi:hypothetical protein N7493_002997 [Penicillium malachiteum]|uniref:Uncharacterized protein n=1 Tax=Penicillium malachiteum TaxID=1324776 RepID=A0AAD6HTE8_9EURO|nr:hypothetical protein N7493_002997 [Penicillium malachiteum]
MVSVHLLDPDRCTFDEADERDYDDDDDDGERDDLSDDTGFRSPAGTSFFSFFGYRGSEPSVEDTARAKQEDEEKHAKLLRGEIDVKSLCPPVGCERPYRGSVITDLRIFDFDPTIYESPDEHGIMDLEIFPTGAALARELADDFYVEAVQYYLASFAPQSEGSVVDHERVIQCRENFDGMDSTFYTSVYDNPKGAPSPAGFQYDEEDCADSDYASSDGSDFY